MVKPDTHLHVGEPGLVGNARHGIQAMDSGVRSTGDGFGGLHGSQTAAGDRERIKENDICFASPINNAHQVLPDDWCHVWPMEWGTDVGGCYAAKERLGAPLLRRDFLPALDFDAKMAGERQASDEAPNLYRGRIARAGRFAF